MKRLIIVLATCLLTMVTSVAQMGGIPFIRNYAASEYEANSRNYDIVAGKNGNIFVANFEGLLCYDQSTWRIIHTKNLTRMTTLHIDKEGALWAGGYNYIGKLMIASNGDVFLKDVIVNDTTQWEVTRIWEENDSTVFLTSNQKVFGIYNNEATFLRDNRKSTDAGLTWRDHPNVTQILNIDKGIRIVATSGDGIFIYGKNGQQLCNISETNGLCSNNVLRICYDGHGLLWGATDNGLFTISVPTAYTRFGPSEGLRGEVLCMRQYNKQTFVGTLSGLYRQEGLEFVHLTELNHACHQLDEMNGYLLAATEDGIFRIDPQCNVKRLGSNSAMSILVEGNHFYSGEGDGIYINDLSGSHDRISDVQKVVKMIRDKEGTLWLQTLYGSIWSRRKDMPVFTHFLKEINNGELATLVQINNQVVVIDALDKKPFEYPQFGFTDKAGLTWLTLNDGKGFYAWQRGKRLTEYDRMLRPFAGLTVRSANVFGSQIWLGGEHGITIIDRSIEDLLLTQKPQLRICSATLNGDSVLWGGFGDCPEILPSLRSNENNLFFTFALDHVPLQGTTLYRYRLEGGNWSEWMDRNNIRYNNQPSGTHVFQVQALYPTGELSDIVSMEFYIANPIYMKWYMVILYVVLLIGCVYYLLRWRVHRLEREKLRLERIVNVRTAEVVKQKDEIEEKSKRLEKALNDLNQAQDELIHQEKMATIGKLTQGLIDRILNPLNYINNFSKLSLGLLKDARENIEDEKANMHVENYEDTMEVLSMISGNLEKVSEHGQNTTRILKAMEEMLKDRTGGIIPIDLCTVLHQDEELVRNYYAKDIKEWKIDLIFDYPCEGLPIEGNAEQLSKTFMSLIENAFYAVEKKKKQRLTFTPEIVLWAKDEGGQKD